MSEPLADEARTFNGNVEAWSMEHGGEFVLLRGSSLIGFFPTYEEALEASYKRFGLTPFFVRQVRYPPRPHLITRFVAPTDYGRGIPPARSYVEYTSAEPPESHTGRTARHHRP